MSINNLPQIIKENIFIKIKNWFKRLIGNSKKNGEQIEGLQQNNDISKNPKEEFIKSIKTKEISEKRIIQIRLKEKQIEISDLNEIELKKLIELYKTQIKNKKKELKKYRKIIFSNN